MFLLSFFKEFLLFLFQEFDFSIFKKFLLSFFGEFLFLFLFFFKKNNSPFFFVENISSRFSEFLVSFQYASTVLQKESQILNEKFISPLSQKFYNTAFHF